ncbi:hypothetical protein FRC16_008808 [Serendipita sp. 398]|nr:hypothetical protein FRC16_008808 [Serendipita sp. 398]
MENLVTFTVRYQSVYATIRRRRDSLNDGSVLLGSCSPLMTFLLECPPALLAGAFAFGGRKIQSLLDRYLTLFSRWVASHCGQPNMYFLPYRCKVTGNTGTRRIAQPKPATYCEGDQTKCVRGAKQPIIWNQAEGSNLITTPGQLPGYNMKLGFADGAQNDIFEPEPTPSQSTAAPSNTTVANPPTRSALECLGMKAVKVLDKRRLHRRWIKL